MRRWALISLAAAAGMASADLAFAAGGAHVIDDSEVETAGLCHAETWFTEFGDGRGLVNVSPACTFRALPTVEFGAGITHGWQDGDEQTLIGPSLKVALRPVDADAGVGVALSAAIDPSTGTVATAAVLVPVTIDLSPKIRTNLNIGYLWARSGDRHVLFAGAQIEARVHDTLSLMAEGFIRNGHSPGFQAGLRWTPRQWVDVDLLGGHRVDGTAATAFTIGLTLRH